jgi:hypothetical protein
MFMGRAAAPLVEREIDHRRGEQRQHLAGDQPAHDGDAQRAAQLGPVAKADGQRQRAQRGGQRGHQDRAEAQQAGLADRLVRGNAARAFGIERKVDDQDRVLLHDADQQDDADQRDEVELPP